MTAAVAEAREPVDYGATMTEPAPHSTHADDPTAPLTRGLARDMARMFDQIGVESVWARVVDTESMVFQSAWSVNESGESAEEMSFGRMNSASPWAAGMIRQLAESPVERTLVQKLSPHHWAFAWRFDDQHAVVASARYREWHDVHSDAHTALVRLVCDTGIRAGQVSGPGAPAAAEGQPQLVWPTVERRSKVPETSRRTNWLVAGGALLALMLGMGAILATLNHADELQSDALRLQAMTDSTMTQTLSAALATGDYGDVQVALSSFSSLGYFEGAVVTNSRQRIIATAGSVNSARIGEPLPLTPSSAARFLDLVQGSVRHGQLVTLGASTQVPIERGFRLMLVSAMLVSLSIGAAAAWLVVRKRKRNGARG